MLLYNRARARLLLVVKALTVEFHDKYLSEFHLIYIYLVYSYYSSQNQYLDMREKKVELYWKSLGTERASKSAVDKLLYKQAPSTSVAFRCHGYLVVGYLVESCT